MMTKWAMVVVIAAVMTGLVAPAPVGAATDIDAAADEIRQSGRYLEFGTNPELDAAIADANARGVAFAWFDGDLEAVEVADALADAVRDTPYRTVLVLTNTSVGASSPTVSDPAIESGLTASESSFVAGDVAGGVAGFVTGLTGEPAGSTATTSSPPSTGTDQTDDSSSNGFGSTLLLLLLGGVAVIGFLVWRGRRRTSKQVERDLEADRAEIAEQLRDNADHVLGLGDRVISSGRDDLIATYEAASAAYQDVSQSLDGATTAAEIDRLDDKIDHAEWQFESIEAQLEGRPAPPSPADVAAEADESRRATERADTGTSHRGNDRPALGADESIFDTGGRPGTGLPSGPSRRPGPTPRRRGGGGLGGALGGPLGSILGSIVLGGMTGGRSRRTRRRRGSSPFPGAGGAVLRPGGGSSRRPTGGGLGGGVLRRGGSSGGGRGGRSLGRGGRGGRRL